MQEGGIKIIKKFIGESGKFYTAVEKWINKMLQNNRGDITITELWITGEYLHNI